MNEVIARVKALRLAKSAKGLSIGFHGNVVTLWEALAKEEELLVELGSDQTSLHNPYGGGYYPVQLSFEEAQVGEGMGGDYGIVARELRGCIRRVGFSWRSSQSRAKSVPFG